MYFFLIVLALLYICSLIEPFRNNFYPLDKDRTLCLKGILSFLIIAFHIQFLVDIPILFLFNSWGAPVVSLFFFISGYGSTCSYLKKGNRYLDGFFYRRIWKTIKPFLVVTAIYMLLEFMDKGCLSSPSLVELIRKGDTILPYSWFVIAIIIQYLFFFFSFKYGITMRRKIIYVLVLTIIGMIIMSSIHYGRHWWVSSLAFPAGMVYAFKESSWNSILKQKKWRFLFMPVICVVILIVVMSKVEALFTIVYILIPLLVVYLISYVGGNRNKIMMFLGSISYEIYLFHGVSMYILRGKHIYVESDYLFVLLVCVCTILFSYCLHKVIYGDKK